jgi:hypothetical protein
MITARYVRAAAAISLVLNAVLSVVAIALMPAFSASTVTFLKTIDAAGSTATISAAAFVIAQLPFIIAALGLAHLAGIRAPIIAIVGGTIAVIGGFGHAVFGGTQLLQLGMAADTANHGVYAGLIDGDMPLPLTILMMCGTAGTVLGMLLLGVAVLRGKVGPRWVPYAIWVWLLVEFVGSGLTEWATLASGLLYLGTLGTLAVTVWRSPLAVWASVADARAARSAESLTEPAR